MVFQAGPSPRVMFPWAPLGPYLAGHHRPAPDKTLCHPPSLQEPSLPSPGQLLAKPLTRLDGENPQHALDINKVVSDTSGRGQGGPMQEPGSWVLAGTTGPPHVLPLPCFVSTDAAAPGGWVLAVLAGADHGHIPGEAGAAAASPAG